MKSYKFWGWGLADEIVPEKEASEYAASIAKMLSIEGELDKPTPPPQADEISLREPRLTTPEHLSDIVSNSHEDRLIHHYGKSYYDTARSFERKYDTPPDAIARPRSEEELISVMEWANDAGAALIPYGAGSSVVGGTESRDLDNFNGSIILNTQALNQILEIDTVSKSARIQAGILGPELEAGLKPSGLTLRHFPQSFEYSTLGGWIACRAAGHYATRFTHVDDFVQSLRVVTPQGVAETRRLPSSGSGPDANRLWLGSEGTLGVITEAWVRLQAKPKFRASATVYFDDFFKGAEAVRAIVQSGMAPANCRLVTSEEAASIGAHGGGQDLLLLGYESSDRPVDAQLERAIEISKALGGTTTAPENAPDSAAWRQAFLRLPYYREVLTSYGFMLDTFATSITWDRFEDFVKSVKADTEKAIQSVTGNRGLVTTRFSNAYPDGPAPYFTFFAKGKQGQLSSQWLEIRHAAIESVVRNGGPATHHQAVGRDHMPFYSQERPELYAQMLGAAKASIDPSGYLNPGVLVPDRGA